MQTHMFYLVLNKDYELEEYLLTIRGRKQRQILSQYKLGENKLAIKRERHNKAWQHKESPTYDYCLIGKVETETEMHFPPEV